MRHGLGVLRWSPSEFWAATPTELYRGIEGWQECHGVGPYATSPERPGGWMQADEVKRLRELEEMFPDE